MKKLFDEFKKFINKGNAIDLAVGVVVGSAFTSIVNSIVSDLISPIIGLIIGGLDFSDIKIHLLGDAYINIGSFIQNVLDFLIIAFVLFVIVKGINTANEKLIHKEEEEPKKEDPDDVKLLKSIESELKKLNKKVGKQY